MVNGVVVLALGVAGIVVVLCAIAGVAELHDRWCRWRHAGSDRADFAAYLFDTIRARMAPEQRRLCRALDLMGVEFDRVEWIWPHE